MKIRKSTEKYESWLSERTDLIRSDLELKHRLMAKDPFLFLRGTFYRWMQVWDDAVPDLSRAPEVLAVGDLHVENFGSWRDTEGRLIWGINDFDEAYPLPYTNDLVRLAVSAKLAGQTKSLAIKFEDACEGILRGYVKSLAIGGEPFVLEEEKHAWLQNAVTGELRSPARFWTKMNALAPVRGNVPKGAIRAIESSLPEPDLQYKLTHRISGLGSLGRERFVAIANWDGGKIAHETKPVTSSASLWANGDKGYKQIFYEDILENSSRARDASLKVRGRWLVRRLAPYCTRIELSMLPKRRDEKHLLEAMGFETANIHLGSWTAIKAVRRDVARRKSGWLISAAKKMSDCIMKDWQEWRRR
jgi:uncharacterized protein DUF2252